MTRITNKAFRGPAGLAVLTALVLSTTGCVFWAPTLDPVRYDLEREMPGTHFDSKVKLRFGRLSMGLARIIARAAVDDAEDEAAINILRHVKKVEVAVYEVEDLSEDERLAWPRKVRHLADRRGWVQTARFQDEDAIGSVMLRMDAKGSIRSVYLFTLDDENLVLARFSGRLDRALAEAVALSGRDLTSALTGDGPDSGLEEDPEVQSDDDDDDDDDSLEAVLADEEIAGF